jgi:hypothetical protein
MNERYHYALGLKSVPQQICDVAKQAAVAITMDLVRKFLFVLSEILDVVVLALTTFVGYFIAPLFGYVPPRFRFMVPTTDEEFIKKDGTKPYARFFCGFSSEPRVYVIIAGKRVTAFWPLAVGYVMYVAYREIVAHSAWILWLLGVVVSFFAKYGAPIGIGVAAFVTLAGIIFGLCFVVIPAIGRGATKMWKRVTESEVVQVGGAYARSFKDKTCVLVEYQGEFPDIEQEGDDKRMIRLELEVAESEGICLYTIPLPSGERLSVPRKYISGEPTASTKFVHEIIIRSGRYWYKDEKIVHDVKVSLSQFRRFRQFAEHQVPA